MAFRSFAFRHFAVSLLASRYLATCFPYLAT